MAATPQQLSEQIDRLFEHYLSLLHQYDSLRRNLNILQASTLQNLARANFEAPRGTRYGEDLYDARIQATRLCRVTEDPDTATADFTLATAAVTDKEQAASGASEAEDATQQKGEEDENVADEEERRATRTKKLSPKDPIRMFGLLGIPSSLRVAQSEAVKMLNIVPELASVDAQMKDIEIQIRRARKHRSKAEAAEKAQVLEAGRDPVSAS